MTAAASGLDWGVIGRFGPLERLYGLTALTDHRVEALIMPPGIDLIPLERPFLEKDKAINMLARMWKPRHNEVLKAEQGQ
jgi:hypothetical protein